MLSLLNRLSWLLSFTFSISIVLLITLGGGYIYSSAYYYNPFDYFFPIIILACFLKWTLFSKRKISLALGTLPVQEGEIQKVSKSEDKKLKDVEEAKVDETSPFPSSHFITEHSRPWSTPDDTNQYQKEWTPLSTWYINKFIEWVKSFFTDRPLAKVWGILLFLGALFFLWLIFDAVWPVGKILVWLSFGMTLIGIGAWLDTKSIHVESRVLMGVWLAVNTLTILAGRHLLSGGGIAGDALFSDLFATIALILNILLSVVIALVYQSRVLLWFAFVLGYTTPFIVGSENSSVLLLTAYTTVLTIGVALITNFYAKMKNKDSIVFLGAVGTIGMTGIFSLIASRAWGNDLMILFTGLTLSLLSLSYLAFRERRSPLLFFGWSYVVLFLAFLGGQYFLLSSIILSLGFFWVLFFFIIGSINLITYSVFAWLAFFMGILWFLTGNASLIVLFLLGITLFCNIGVALWKTGSLLLGWLGLIGLTWVILAGNTNLTTLIESQDTFIVKGFSLLLLVGASIFTLRLKSVSLFLFGVIASGFLIMYPNSVSLSLTWTAGIYILYSIISYGVPYFILQNMTDAEKPYLLASFPISTIITSYGIYQIGSLHFPGIALWGAYMIYAFITLSSAYFMTQKLFPEGLGKITEGERTTYLVLFSIPLSLFTFALAFLFEDVPWVMSLAWMIESSLLYFLYTRKNERWIFLFASIICLIGIGKELLMISSLVSWDWLSFGILSIMLVNAWVGLYFLKNEKGELRVIYDILHILALSGIIIGLFQIIPSSDTWWSIMSLSILTCFFAWFYRLYGVRIQKLFLIALSLITFGLFLYDFETLIKDHPLPLIVQGISISAFLFSWFISSRISDKISQLHLSISIVGSLILSSLYINHFWNTFAVTLYLALIATILITRGITWEKPALRTMGLYIGVFVLIKIFWNDIWYGNNTMVIRVIALMVIWGIMIILSQLYAKQVSRSWSEEFSLWNFSPHDSVWKDGKTPSP